jgi:hypothetical protein
MLAALGQSLVVGELPFGTTGEAGIAFCLKAVATFAVAGKHLQERPELWRRRTARCASNRDATSQAGAPYGDNPYVAQTKDEHFFLQPINTKHFTTSSLTFGIGLAFLSLSRDEARVLPASP